MSASVVSRGLSSITQCPVSGSTTDGRVRRDHLSLLGQRVPVGLFTADGENRHRQLGPGELGEFVRRLRNDTK